MEFLTQGYKITPGPWLVRFLRSGENPQEPNLQHRLICSNQKHMTEEILSLMYSSLLYVLVFTLP